MYGSSGGGYGGGGKSNNSSNQSSGSLDSDAQLSDITFKDSSEKVIPNSLSSNPSPLENIGQDFYSKHRDQVEKIMETFLTILPSNYVSQVKGPFYTLQFQSAAEQIAKIQVMAQEVFSDSDFYFTRSEFIYQIIGVLVNPNYGQKTFIFDTDLELRNFLRRMIVLLLNGSKKASIEQGLYLLTDGDITIVEKSLEMKTTPNSAYTIFDQFEFEISLSVIENTSSNHNHYHKVSINKDGNGKTIEIIGEHSAHIHEIYEWEVLPAMEGGHNHILVSQFSETLKKIFDNLDLVLEILKPAHTVYQFRHMFREVFGNLFSDTFTMDMNYSHYDDMRMFCEGAKRIIGVGNTLIDRSLFTDPTKNFRNVSSGSTLVVLNGENSDTYIVEDVLSLPIGADIVPRRYTTSNGLSGTLIVLSNDTIEDTTQNFSSCEENTTITILEGGNQGTYRMETLLGSNGGKVGFTSGFSSKVKLGHSTLRLTQRMKKSLNNQNYEVSVDRLGVRKPNSVQGKDISSLFYL